MQWYEVLVSVLVGLSTCIPLVVKLVEYVKKAIKEKNWGDLLKLVTSLMEEAEGKFNNGEDRKQWVIMSVKAMSNTVNYDIDIDNVAELVDSLCELTKKVNAPKVEQAEPSQEITGE